MFIMISDSIILFVCFCISRMMGLVHRSEDSHAVCQRSHLGEALYAVVRVAR